MSKFEENEIDELFYLEEMIMLFCGHKPEKVPKLFVDKPPHLKKKNKHIFFDTDRDSVFIGDTIFYSWRNESFDVESQEAQLENTFVSWLEDDPHIIESLRPEVLSKKDSELDKRKLLLPKKLYYFFWMRLLSEGKSEYSNSETKLFFKNFPPNECFQNCDVEVNEIDQFLLAQHPFQLQQVRENTTTNSMVIFDDGNTKVTTKLLKQLSKEAPQLEKILIALAQWSEIPNRKATDLAELLHKQLGKDWGNSNKKKNSCSNTQLNAIETVFLPPPPKGAGNTKKYGNIVEEKE